MPVLNYLDLSDNHIGNKGGISLARVIDNLNGFQAEIFTPTGPTLGVKVYI
jgi:hypothetical protein